MKQETLEDVRANSYIDFAKSNEDVCLYSFVVGWNKGSKWQQERSYSEDDMLQAFEFYAERAICDIKYLDDDFTEFIKQFKKK